MEGPALFVVALGRGKVEPLADRDVMGEEVTGHGLRDGGLAVVYRHDIHDPGTVVDAHHEGLDALQRHQQHETHTARHRADPAGGRHLPCAARITRRARDAIRIPRGSLAVVDRKRPGRHGAPPSCPADPPGVRCSAGAGALIGCKAPSQRAACDAQPPRARATSRHGSATLVTLVTLVLRVDVRLVMAGLSSDWPLRLKRPGDRGLDLYRAP